VVEQTGFSASGEAHGKSSVLTRSRGLAVIPAHLRQELVLHLLVSMIQSDMSACAYSQSLSVYFTTD